MSMDLSQKNIGIAITGSYCTYKKVFAELEKLASTGANLYPIFSDHASTTDSRFGKCADFLEQAEKNYRKETDHDHSGCGTDRTGGPF